MPDPIPLEPLEITAPAPTAEPKKTIPNVGSGEVVVIVDGKKFDRFLSLSLTRTKLGATCKGQLVLSWPGAEQFNASSPPAQELVDGADGQILLMGQMAASIKLDTRTSKGSATNYELTLEFRGELSKIVDSSPKHKTGQENKKTPAEILRKLFEGYNVRMIDKSNVTKKIERFIIAEGETVERAARRAAREYGLNFWEKPTGELILEPWDSKGGTGQALRIGRNFTDWSTKRDMEPRSGETILKGNCLPTDECYGKQGESHHAEERRDIKPKNVRTVKVLADTDQDKQTIKDRAKYEAQRRTSQGLKLILKMSTWVDDSGKLWDCGTKHHVTIPVDQIDDDLEIEEVTFDLAKEQRTATVTLVSHGSTTGGEPILSDPPAKEEPPKKEEPRKVPDAVEPPETAVG